MSWAPARRANATPPVPVRSSIVFTRFESEQANRSSFHTTTASARPEVLDKRSPPDSAWHFTPLGRKSAIGVPVTRRARGCDRGGAPNDAPE